MKIIKTSFKTVWVLGIVTAGLIAFDIYAFKTPEKGDTISELILLISQHPVVPFIAGVLCGHLFWPQYVKKDDKE